MKVENQESNVDRLWKNVVHHLSFKLTVCTYSKQFNNLYRHNLSSQGKMLTVVWQMHLSISQLFCVSMHLTHCTKCNYCCWGLKKQRSATCIWPYTFKKLCFSVQNGPCSAPQPTTGRHIRRKNDQKTAK